MKLTLLSTLLVVIFNCTAYALPLCDLLLQKSKFKLVQSQKLKVGVSVNQFGEVTSKKEVQELIQVIKDVNKQLDQYFYIPKKMEVNIFRYDQTAYKTSKMVEGEKQLLIRTPYQFGLRDYQTLSTKGLSKHPVYSRSILAHEYGHAVFDRNIYKALPEFKQIEDIGNQMVGVSRYIKELEQAIIRVKNGAPLPKKFKSLDELVATFKNLTKEYKNAMQNPVYKYSALITEVSRGQNELFADMTAAIYAGKPDVITDALNMAKIQLDPFDYRSFDSPIAVKNWHEAEEHILFSPMRYHVGRNYLFNSKYARHRPVVLKKVFNAIIEELRLYSHAVYKQQYAVFKGLTPAKLNQRLMKNIDSRFTNYDVSYVKFDQELMGMKKYSRIELKGSAVHPEMPFYAEDKLVSYGLDFLQANQWKNKYYQLQDIKLLKNMDETAFKKLGFKLEKNSKDMTVYDLFPMKHDVAHEGGFGQKVFIDHKANIIKLETYTDEYTQTIIMRKSDEKILENVIKRIKPYKYPD